MKWVIDGFVDSEGNQSMTLDASDIRSFIGDIGAARLGYGFAEILWDTLSKVGMAAGDEVYLVVGQF